MKKNCYDCGRVLSSNYKPEKLIHVKEKEEVVCPLCSKFSSSELSHLLDSLVSFFDKKEKGKAKV